MTKETQPFEAHPELAKVLLWFANNVGVPGTQWSELIRQINKAVVTPSPVSGSLEDAAVKILDQYKEERVINGVRFMYYDKKNIVKAMMEFAGAAYGNKDYEEVIQDHKRLVRELDEIINGKEGMAKQASLCDIVSQLKKEYSRPSIDIIDGVQKAIAIIKDYGESHWKLTEPSLMAENLIKQLQELLNQSK